MTPEEIRRLRRIYGEGLNEPLEKMDLSGSNLKDPYEPKLSINQRPGIWDEKYKHDKFLKSRESISSKPHLFAGDTNKIPLTFFYEDKLSIDYFNKKIPKTLFGEKEPRKLDSLTLEDLKAKSRMRQLELDLRKIAIMDESVRTPVQRRLEDEGYSLVGTARCRYTGQGTFTIEGIPVGLESRLHELKFVDMSQVKLDLSPGVTVGIYQR